MPALNLPFSDDEMDELRAAAAEQDTSVKALVHDAALTEIHRRKVTSAAVRVAGISAGLNARLAER